MRKRPFFFVGLISFLAALTASLTSPTIGIVTAALIAVLLMLLSWPRKVPLSPRVAAVIGAWALVVSVLFALRVSTDVSPQLALDGTVTTLTMRVEQVLTSSNACIVRVEDGDVPTGTKLCLWLGYRVLDPKCGDLLTGEVELAAAYDSEREDGNTAKANGVYLHAWATKNATVVWQDGQASLPLGECAIYRLRETIHNTLYRNMTYEAAAIGEGMMLGNRDNLSYDIRRAFRTSGVYHLLAVSGVHLSIITCVLLYIGHILGLPKRLRTIITMASIVLFMALCGFTASVTRAGCMTLFTLVGNMAYRRSDGLNSLGLAASLMLAIDPFCVYDLGWQLSFAATCGLLLMAPIWEQDVTANVARVIPRIAYAVKPICSAVGVSLCASLFTLPLTMVYFGEVSTVFLIGNLLCVPIASVLLVLNFAAVLTAWLEPVSSVLFAVAERVCDALLLCTSRIASWSFASVSTNMPFLLVWTLVLAAALMVAYYLRRMRGVYRVCVGMCALLVLVVGIAQTAARGTSYITIAASDHVAVTVRTASGCGLIVQANSEALEAAKPLLERERAKQIEWMLWLGEPSDQAADLSAVTYPTERLLVAASPNDYAVLPNATHTTVLHAQDELRFGTDGVLRQQGHAQYMTVGGVRCLITTDGVDTASLNASWCDVDVWVATTMPMHAARIKATYIVVVSDTPDAQWQEQFPDAMLSAKGEAIRFSVRDANITLRE